jgi:hypothetical protein
LDASDVLSRGARVSRHGVHRGLDEAMSDKIIQDYIEMERARCASLVTKLARGPDKAFLLFAIDRAVTLADIPHQRKMFDQMSPNDDFEDLM